jgi:hypothetical protein
MVLRVYKENPHLYCFVCSSKICNIFKLQIRRQIQTNRAPTRGQIRPSTIAPRLNAADTKAYTLDTATLSIWPLMVSFCVSAAAA